jgi:hypothetical protein
MLGPRFNEHSLPLEVLKDWAAFEELIVEVARSLYRTENPNRQRVPRGFADGFSLHLSGVEGGSAVPVIEQVGADDASLFQKGFFTRARDLVIRTVAVALTGAIPPEFPRELLGYFDKFGKSLRNDERIELVVPGEATRALYDQAVRKRLVLTGAPEYRQTTELRGKIFEANARKCTCTLMLSSGEQITGTFVPELCKSVIEALSEYHARSAMVLAKGTVVFDRGERPTKMEEMSHIELLDPNDVPARLEALAQLRDGWLDGSGVAPSVEGTSWLADAWTKHFPDDLPDPFTYPTEDGGVQMEWTFGSYEVSAKVDLRGKDATLLAVDVDGGDDAEAVTHLGAAKGWKELAEFVRRHGVAQRA